jgi:hypothetical protein
MCADPLLGSNRETDSHGNESMRNNRGSVGNGIFYMVGAKGLYNENTSRAVASCCQSVNKRVGGWCGMFAGQQQHEHRS